MKAIVAAKDAKDAKEKAKAEKKAGNKKKMRQKDLTDSFYSKLQSRMQERKDLGEQRADNIRLGEGQHWKRRYYAEKFAVAQEDLVDFLQRIRKAYIKRWKVN